MGDPAQHQVAGLVPIAIVDRLELVASMSSTRPGPFPIARRPARRPQIRTHAAHASCQAYAGVSVATRRRLHRNDTIAETLQSHVQTLQEGLGGIRDVLLDHSPALFLAKFDRLDRRFRNAQAANQFIGAAPRYAARRAGSASGSALRARPTRCIGTRV